MRKSLSLLAPVAALVLWASVCFAFRPDDFRKKAELGGTLKPNSLYALRIPPEVMKEAAENLRDIRLVSGGGREIPYSIISESLPAAERSYALKPVEYVKKGGEPESVILEHAGRPVLLNAIGLGIDGRDFTATVTVFGGRDRAEWTELGRRLIYDFSSRLPLRETTLRFPASGYPFYKLAISREGFEAKDAEELRLRYKGLEFSSSGGSNRDFRITGFTGYSANPGARETVYDRASITDFHSKADDKGNTVIRIDEGYPIERLLLRISDPAYSRGLMIYGSDTGKDDSWRLIKSASISRSQGQAEYRAVELQAARKSPHYKFVVINGDSPPLGIREIKFEWARRLLLFYAPSEPGGLSLYLGDPKAEMPDYDIPRVINQSNWDEQSIAGFLEIGAISDVAGYRPPEEREAGEKIENAVFLAAIIGSVLLMAVWLLRLVKGRKKEA